MSDDEVISDSLIFSPIYLELIDILRTFAPERYLNTASDCISEGKGSKPFHVPSTASDWISEGKDSEQYAGGVPLKWSLLLRFLYNPISY